jgi:hypothetical protein
MSFKLGVLAIHGMGDQRANFADGMIRELARRIADLGSDPADICWEPVFWADVLETRQTALLRELSAASALRYRDLRHFIVHSLGDAVAYQLVPRARQQVNVYRQIHRRVAECVKRLRRRTREGKPPSAPDVPLVILAHSLGCHIMSNYVWDVQRAARKKRGTPRTPLERMESLAAIVTFGCNIALFTLAYNDVEPIAFPPRTLGRHFPKGTAPKEIRRAARWVNYYDPDDVLAYPLKPLSGAYDRTVSADVAINVGSPLASWNPMSHLRYWTDDDFTQPVSDVIHGVLRLL